MTFFFDYDIKVLASDYGEEVIPVPIPNTEVKLFSVDDSAFWCESRKLLALLASTLSRPRVYDKKGITAVINAVRKQSTIRKPRFGAAENFPIISAGWLIIQEPAVAKIKV